MAYKGSLESVDKQSKGTICPDCKCLFVEDNRIAQKVGMWLLQDISSKVDLAATVKEAREAIIGNTYNFIVLDVGLPDGDGREIAQFIHESEASMNKGVPTFIVSSHVAPEKINVDHVHKAFAKPLDRNKLIMMRKIVKKALER